MIDLHNDPRVTELCRQFRVKRLAVFGSYAKGCEADSSDVDLLVDFNRNGFEGAFDQFMGFKEAMEKLVEKPVDLISSAKFRNPVFAEELSQSMRVIYG